MEAVLVEVLGYSCQDSTLVAKELFFLEKFS